MNTCVCLKERNLKRGFIVGWARFVFRASLATRVPEQQHHIRALIIFKCVLCVWHDAKICICMKSRQTLNEFILTHFNLLSSQLGLCENRSLLLVMNSHNFQNQQNKRMEDSAHDIVRVFFTHCDMR